LSLRSFDEPKTLLAMAPKESMCCGLFIAEACFEVDVPGS
jgi:hypothetical protein